MKRIGFAFLALLFLAATVRADQTTSAVQQALKDQGFFYGDVDGKKSVDTTAAIRRYQIRNGLQVTGEIDAETLRSLGIGAAAALSTPGRKPGATPAAADSRDDGAPTQSAEIYSQQPAEDTDAHGTHPEPGAVFEGTPYEMAPPDLQRRVIVGAQTLLTRFGYYRSGIDGEFGPGTAAAARAFQSQMGLVPDGRLNMETLGALGLLPGQHARAFSVPRRRNWPRPVYRGQWVPEYPYR
jgi:peptidoglycan hydrolase-like protein with peptidoglycan-binding domain